MLGSLIGIVFVVIAMNFIMLYIRIRRDWPRKPARKAMEEDKAVMLRDRYIQSMLSREQEESERLADKRNKTLDLYEQVRKKHEDDEENPVQIDDTNP